MLFHHCFIAFTPGPHRIKDRLEASTKLCERIFNSRRNLGIDLAVSKSALLHSTKLGCEYLLRYAADEFFELTEVLCSGHQVAQDQYLPLISNENQRSFHRTSGQFVFLVFSLMFISPVFFIISHPKAMIFRNSIL